MTMKKLADTLSSKAAFFVRNAVLLALTAMMFVSSFFTTFKIKADDGAGGGTEMRQSSLQAISGLFAGGYDEEEYARVAEKLYKDLRFIQSVYGVAIIASEEDKEAIQKAFSKINMYRVGMTAAEVKDGVLGYLGGGGSDRESLVYSLLGIQGSGSEGEGLNDKMIPASRVQAVIHGLLALFQMLAGAAFIALFIVSLAKRKEFPAAKAAMFVMLGLAVLFAVALVPGKMYGLGIAVGMPIAAGAIGIALQLAQGIIIAVGNKTLKLKPLIFRASAAALSFAAIITFTCLYTNTVKYEYDNIFESKSEMSAGIRPFEFKEVFGADDEGIPGYIQGTDNESGFLYGIEDMLRTAKFVPGSLILSAVFDSEYSGYEDYKAIPPLLSFVPILTLLAAGVFLWQAMWSLVQISENKYKKYELISTICSLVFVMFTLAVSIIFMLTMNETLGTFGVPDPDTYIEFTTRATIGFGPAGIFGLLFGGALLAATLVTNSLEKRRQTAVGAQAYAGASQTPAGYAPPAGIGASQFPWNPQYGAADSPFVPARPALAGEDLNDDSLDQGADTAVFTGGASPAGAGATAATPPANPPASAAAFAEIPLPPPEEESLDLDALFSGDESDK